METWKTSRRPLLSCIGVRELCDIVLEYAYETQGVPLVLDQPPAMSYVWGVALLTNDTFATATLTGEIFMWNLQGGRKLDGYSQLKEDLQAIVAWRGLLVTASNVAVRVWESGECVSTLHTGHVDLMTTAGDWLVLAKFDGFLKVLDQKHTKFESNLTVFDKQGDQWTMSSHAKTIVRVMGMDDKIVVCGVDCVDVYRIGQSVLTPVHQVLGMYHTASCFDEMLVTWVEDLRVSVWGPDCDLEIQCEVLAACPLDRHRVAIACKDQVGLCDIVKRTYTPLTEGLAVVRLVQLVDGRLAGHTKNSVFIWDLCSKLQTSWPSTGHNITCFEPMGSKVLVCYDNPLDRVRVFE